MLQLYMGIQIYYLAVYTQPYGSIVTLYVTLAISFTKSTKTELFMNFGAEIFQLFKPIEIHTQLFYDILHLSINPKGKK